jgi:hypothetical protein
MSTPRCFRWSRALVLLALAGLAGLVTDWLRSERVVFARPLPAITPVTPQ